MIAAPPATKRPDNMPAWQMVAYKNGRGTLAVRCQRSRAIAADTFANVGIKAPPAK